MGSIHTAKAMLVATALIGASGCATAAISGFRETEKSPGLEVRSRGSSLGGSYIGTIERDGSRFARIVIQEPRALCDDHSRIEMQLPLSAEKEARPLFKEALPPGTEKGKPVTIWMGDPDDTDTRQPVKAEAWPGYPDTVAFRHEMEDPPSVAYRFGPGPSDLRDEGIEDDLAWVCRSRIVYYGSALLIPFAVVFDIVTFPVQLLVISFEQ